MCFSAAIIIILNYKEQKVSVRNDCKTLCFLCTLQLGNKEYVQVSMNSL